MLEELLGSRELRKPSTSCTACDSACRALVRTGEEIFFRSLWTVAKADCAAVRFPAVSALPSVVMSVESCVPEVVPVTFKRF